ncbi:MAG TPA: tetratricopeptide repeat protein [Candidatus Eisenbacteria bacterium]|nr:tetratricopeptide repeat protein [Candidatus Eisenbacteria bacterium]
MPRLRIALASTLVALVLAAGIAAAQTTSLVPGAHREPSGRAASEIERAKGLMGQGRLPEALAAFQSAASMDSLSSQTLETLGIAYQTANMANDAYAAYRRATELDPTSASAWNRAGQVLLADLGRPAAALASFQQALAIDPEYAPAYFSRSVYHLFRGELDEADKDIQQARIHPADEDQSRFLYGAELQMLLAHGMMREAEQGLRQQVFEFPSDVRSAQALTLVYRLTGRPEKARTQMNALMSRLPTQAPLLNEQGMIEQALGHPDSAIVSFNTAWTLDSTSAEAGFHLAHAHLAAGDTLRGLAWLSQVEARDPAFYPTAFLAARVFAARGEKALAERALARAKHLHPSTLGGLTAIAPAGADSALAAAERDLLAGDLAAAVNRGYAACKNPAQRGRALLIAAWASHTPAGSRATAVTQLEAALQALPGSDKLSRAEAERELGRAHLRIGNKDDARQHLERSLEILPPKDAGAAPAAAALIDLYLDLGDKAAAGRLAKKVGATDDPDLLAALGRLADSTGDGKSAAALRDRAKAMAFLP